MLYEILKAKPCALQKYFQKWLSKNSLIFPQPKFFLKKIEAQEERKLPTINDLFSDFFDHPDCTKIKFPLPSLDICLTTAENVVNNLTRYCR